MPLPSLLITSVAVENEKHTTIHVKCFSVGKDEERFIIVRLVVQALYCLSLLSNVVWDDVSIRKLLFRFTERLDTLESEVALTKHEMLLALGKSGYCQ